MWLYVSLYIASAGKVDRGVLHADERLQWLEAEHVSLPPNQRSRGDAFRRVRSYSAAFAVFFSVVFPRRSHYTAQHRLPALMSAYSVIRLQWLFLLHSLGSLWAMEAPSSDLGSLSMGNE